MHAAALLAVAHIALTERDQGQHDDANSHRTENTNSDVGFEHGGSSDGLSLQDISPEELWDALVTAIEEGEAHGLSHLRRLCRDQISRHRLALPNECSNDAINDAIRKVFGPLVHGLVADADCRGGRGGGASQQFNGF